MFPRETGQAQHSKGSWLRRSSRIDMKYPGQYGQH